MMPRPPTPCPVENFSSIDGATVGTRLSSRRQNHLARLGKDLQELEYCFNAHDDVVGDDTLFVDELGDGSGEHGMEP